MMAVGMCRNCCKQTCVALFGKLRPACLLAFFKGNAVRIVRHKVLSSKEFMPVQSGRTQGQLLQITFLFFPELNIRAVMIGFIWFHTKRINICKTRSYTYTILQEDEAGLQKIRFIFFTFQTQPLTSNTCDLRDGIGI